MADLDSNDGRRIDTHGRDGILIMRFCRRDLIGHRQYDLINSIGEAVMTMTVIQINDYLRLHTWELIGLV